MLHTDTDEKEIIFEIKKELMNIHNSEFKLSLLEDPSNYKNISSDFFKVNDKPSLLIIKTKEIIEFKDLFCRPDQIIFIRNLLIEKDKRIESEILFKLEENFYLIRNKNEKIPQIIMCENYISIL